MVAKIPKIKKLNGLAKRLYDEWYKTHKDNENGSPESINAFKEYVSEKCSNPKGDVGHNSGNSDAGSNNKWCVKIPKIKKLNGLAKRLYDEWYKTHKDNENGSLESTLLKNTYLKSVRILKVMLDITVVIVMLAPIISPRYRYHKPNHLVAK